MNAKRAVVYTVVLATILLSIPVISPTASARPRYEPGIRVDVAPPPLRQEVVVVRPGPRHIWVPGYWNWAPGERQYVWVGGRWVLPPYRHAVWVGPHWVHRGHHTFFIRGHWRR